MRITDVTTTVRDLDEAERFYRDVLGMPTQRDDAEAMTVRVGTTELRLELDRAGVACDHLAFTIPADAFAAAKAWLAQRVDLLAAGAVDEFEGPPGWDSRSVYFPGPSGAVLELIARRRLPATSAPAVVPAAGPAAGSGFDARDVWCISEVGVAVPDVATAVNTLSRADLLPFGDLSDNGFAPVGDDHGLFILVSAGRPWAPTHDRRSTVSPLTITAAGTATGPASNPASGPQEVTVGRATLRITT